LLEQTRVLVTNLFFSFFGRIVTAAGNPYTGGFFICSPPKRIMF